MKSHQSLCIRQFINDLSISAKLWLSRERRERCWERKSRCFPIHSSHYLRAYRNPNNELRLIIQHHEYWSWSWLSQIMSTLGHWGRSTDNKQTNLWICNFFSTIFSADGFRWGFRHKRWILWNSWGSLLYVKDFYIWYSFFFFRIDEIDWDKETDFCWLVWKSITFYTFA